MEEKSKSLPQPSSASVRQINDAPPINELRYLTGFRLGAVVACMALACFLMLVDTMVIGTAIPRISDEFQSLTDIAWYASTYQFGISIPQPLVGHIYKHFSTRWTFLVFFALFEIGSILCGAAISSSMLIAGRLAAGFGAAGIITGAITVVSSCAPLEKCPTLLGLTMGFQQLGLILGPIIGGAFTTYSTWRWSFYINLPIGAIVIFGLLFLPIPDQINKKSALSILPQLPRYLDLIGFGLLAPAVIQLLLALQFGGIMFPWTSSQVIGLFCGSIATFVVWFIWNYNKGDAALIPPSMLQSRIVWSAVGFNALHMGAIYGLLFYLPIYFQAIKDTSAILSAVYIMPTFLVQLVMVVVTGGLLEKIGYVIPFALFATVLFSIGNGLLSTMDPYTPIGQWVGYQILAGIGSGAALQLGIITIQSVTTAEELSPAMAFIVFSQSLLPTVFLTVGNVIFVAGLQDKLPQVAPGTNTNTIINSGATGFRSFVDPKDLPAVIATYSDSMHRIFYLFAGLVAASSVFIWGMGWQDLRKKPKHMSSPSPASGSNHA